MNSLINRYIIFDFIGIALWLISIAAWVTHVIVCISAKAWVLLVIGALAGPIGVVHGIATWFGFNWT